MSLTARDLLQKLAKDSGIKYQVIAKKVNRRMAEGMGLVQSVKAIASENDLDAKKYRLYPLRTFGEVKEILSEDYSQTLMISAVLAQMVEAKGHDRYPVPAFFLFMEVLQLIPEAPKKDRTDRPIELDSLTTRIIELTTTLVSIICRWSKEGIVGVSDDCPESLQPFAKAVVRKTKMLQNGLWTCISCGTIVDVRTTHALVCKDCDTGLSERIDESAEVVWERERTGYGRTSKGDPAE